MEQINRKVSNNYKKPTKLPNIIIMLCLVEPIRYMHALVLPKSRVLVVTAGRYQQQKARGMTRAARAAEVYRALTTLLREGFAFPLLHPKAATLDSNGYDACTSPSLYLNH